MENEIRNWSGYKEEKRQVIHPISVIMQTLAVALLISGVLALFIHASDRVEAYQQANFYGTSN